MRGKCLVLMLLILVVATFATANMNAHAHSDPQDYVKVYVWNPATASNVYPTLANPATTSCEIWIDSPVSWDNTVSGIVGWTISLQWDPAVVEVLTALQWPDMDYDGTSDGFLGAFLSRYGYNWMGYGVSFLGGTKDAVAGTYSGTAEAILGFSTLGLGAGGGPMPMMRYVIRTLVGVDHTTAYSPLILFDCYYTTVNGTKYPVDIVQSGHYGTPPPQAEFTYTPSEPVVGETVTFNASASYDPDGNITSYEWDFGDETPLGTGNITMHTYDETGTYTVTLNVTDNDGLWDTESKNVTIYGPPVALFTYSPSSPSLAETVTFNASESYDPDGGNETYPSGIVSYEWDFGDATTSTEADPITTHKYFEAGTYTVSLNVTDDEGLTSNTTATVTVSGAAAAAEFDVEVDVGSIYFGGETAEFYVLTSFMGEPVDATQINARLYHSGTPPVDLSGSVENIATGLYKVPYEIPGDAPSGTYALVVNASFITQKGISLKTFLISPTLTGWNALLINIDGNVGTIKTDVGLIEVQLDSINATLIDVNGTVATINSTIGLIAADVSTIDAKVTDIEDWGKEDGILVTIESTLGDIEVDIEDINGDIEDINETLVTIQTDIGEIQTDVEDINANLTNIEGSVGTIETGVGSIEVKLDDIDATIVDIQDGLVTINTTVGDIQLDLGKVSLKLESVQGDIEEGMANVTAAIADAEGNILVELGQVEVRLKDINATLVIIDGSLVTIKTDIGMIKGTITSIRGDTATIETDIGVIKAILEEWTGVTTSSITTPVGTFDIMVLTNSTLEGPVTFSDNALTMIVSGQTSTTGILNVMIPRQLLVGIGSSINEFAVTINDGRAPFTYTEEAEAYMVRIVYTHSTHTITIYLTGSQSSPLPLWILLSVALPMAVTTIVTAAYILRTRKKPIKP